MHVELLEGDCTVKSRQITKDGKTNTMHEQRAYLWMPGAPYPIPFTMSIQDPSQAYSPGNYVFASESIRTNNFGSLEFNRFGMKLIKANIKAENKPELKTA